MNSDNLNVSSRINPMISGLILFALALIAHFRYSWMGFNPTDDGFILAYGRRLIEGQIPHLDFISIRPILSPIIHIPFVLFGGDSVYWYSRLFVWFEFGIISWTWMLIFRHFQKSVFGLVQAITVPIIISVISINYFPIMAWHTIDGILLASLGLLLVLGDNRIGKFVGYLFLGLAYLCKQNFIFMGIGVIFILRDWKNYKYWIILSLPGISYLSILAALGGFKDTINQLTSHSDIFRIGIINYLVTYTFIPGVITGYLSKYFIDKNPKLKENSNHISIINILGVIGFALIAIGAIVTCILGRFIANPAFGLFGAVLGGAIYILRFKKDDTYLKAVLLVLLLAWTVSISVGYNSPALIGGIMVALLIGFINRYFQSINRTGLFNIIILIYAVILLISFDYIRHKYVYRDCSADLLTQNLDGLLPGGNNIKTNPRTHEFFVDMQRAIDQIGHKRYAVIPDCAGYWVKNTQTNPLPLDWPQSVEVCSDELAERLVFEMGMQREKTYILVQKIMASRLNDGYIPLIESQYYFLVRYIHHYYTKIGETKFFEIYQ
jgi:hypothetical protein